MTLFTHLFVARAVLKLLPIFIANMYINIFSYGCDLKPQKSTPKKFDNVSRFPSVLM